MRRLALVAFLVVTIGNSYQTVARTEVARTEVRSELQNSDQTSDQIAVRATTLPPGLARVVDPAIRALWSRFSRETALAHVQFISQYWRLAGNPGYNATLDRVRSRLQTSGFAGSTAEAMHGTPSVWVEEYPNTGKGWSYSVGTLAIRNDKGTDEVVLSRDSQNLSLAINSFSTNPGGVSAPLVDVGRGRPDDFAGKDVTGAVVLGDADVGGLYRAAIGRGAIGVVSTSLGDYINPNPPGAAETPRGQWNILQWGSIPYDEAKKGFGFKATPKAAARLRAYLAESKKADAGVATVHVTIASAFSSSPNRMVVAEIPGRSVASERVVVTAHVQEPGANDNASGVATLTELARAMARAIRDGALPPPERTITFLWLEEISGSRQWLTTHADLAKNVRYMFSMDMTGEDVRKTGGSFLIERWPDPGAVWVRPWDPHTEWGPGSVRENQLKGDLLNDLHLAICARVAARTGWVVKTNPYEGGSDHSEFGRAGIPSVLNWHFTDRYYHSNYDTADKTSPAEMRNVGVSVAASTWLLASANEATSLAVATLVSDAGRARIAIEEREGQKLAEAAADPAAAKALEPTIVRAWRKWYGEAIRSVSRLIVGQPSPAFAKTLENLAAAVEGGAPQLPSDRSPPLADGPQPTAGEQTRTPPPASTVEDVILASDRLRAERWYPPVPGRTTPTPDELLMRQALSSTSALIRAQAVRAIGRFENAADTPRLLPFLADPDLTVRVEAAQAVGQSLKQSRGAAVLPARTAIQARLAAEPILRVRQPLLEALARLRYEHATAVDVAPVLAKTPALLSILLRQDRQVRLNDDAVQALRAEANLDDPARSRFIRDARDALDALYLLGAVDEPLATAALRYHCDASPTCGWEIRFLATQQLDMKQPALVGELETLRHDPSLQVRLAAVTKLAALIPTLQQCRALLSTAAAPTEATTVRLEAIRLMEPQCNEKDEIAPLLISMANGLDGAGSRTAWHLPARAMETLVKFQPVEARHAVDALAVPHAVWQVRAAAARAAAGLKDEDALLKLAADADANVAAEALSGLAQMKSAEVTRAAATALARDNHQLVRAAALALKGSTDPRLAGPALLGALRRLTEAATDNSRDARIAILDRFKEFAHMEMPGVSLLPYVQAADLQPLLRDYDPNVATAAADVIGIVTGARPVPEPTHRAPQQPTAEELRTLPTRATIVLETGQQIDLALLPAEAPLAVYRFAKLANGGRYNGLTFHRVVPLFVIQGGSPGANEYVGDARFMRDEIGFERHTRGAVGISTRGRDTGDAQIFIDLTDQTRLNYEYTIFARVSSPAGLDVIDGVLEGAKIRRISVSR